MFIVTYDNRDFIIKVKSNLHKVSILQNTNNKTKLRNLTISVLHEAFQMFQ